MKSVRLIAFVLAAAALLSLAACRRIPRSTKEERTAVASIDEFEVPYELLRYLVRNAMRDEARGDDAYWTEARAAERQEALYEAAFDRLRTQYAVFSLGKKYAIDRTSGAITELVDSLMDDKIAAYEDEAAYAAALRENYMTDGVYRFFTTVDVCEEELYYAMLDAGDLEADDAKIEPLVRGGEFIRVKQILITTEDGKSAEAMRAEAEEARRRAAAGEDFDALVSEYGEDLFMFHNPDGYYICRGLWYTAFEDAAFALPVGGVSEVIETAAGCSVLLRCEKEEAYLAAHMADLCGDWREAQFSLKIEERAAAMNVVRREALDAYTPLTMTMQ